jgi:hypothetical protein
MYMGSDFWRENETRYKTRYSEKFQRVARRKKYEGIRNEKKDVKAKGREAFGDGSYSGGLSAKCYLRTI